MSARIYRATPADVGWLAKVTAQVRSYGAAVWRSPDRRALWTSLLFAAASAVAFARVTEDYLTRDPLARWDLEFARWLALRRSPLGVDLARIVTDVGSPGVTVLIGAIVALVLYRRRELANAFLVPFVLAGAELLNLLLKVTFHRTRPEVASVHLDTYSYPSGHAMIAITGYGVFAYLLWTHRIRRLGQVLLAIALVVFVLGISFSRLYLGVHYLSDVLGGIAAGAAWLGLAFALRFRYGAAVSDRVETSKFDRFARRITRN